MQAQNASLFLGQIPHPQTGEPEVNLDLAKMIIDQLEMIADKTDGNLTADEAHLLDQTLTGLRLAYVQGSSGSSVEAPAAGISPPRQSVSPVADLPSDPPSSGGTPASSDEESGSRKKFTKSYGA